MAESADRRDMHARVAAIRSMLDIFCLQDSDVLINSLPAPVRDHVSSPRIHEKLAMLRARKIAGRQLLAPTTDPFELALLNGGPDLIETVAAIAGVHVAWRDILRIVERSELDALNASLGMSSRTYAIMGRKAALPIEIAKDLQAHPLLERIRIEGARCWVCWLASLDKASARRLHIITPYSVSTRVPKALPLHKEDRANRKIVIETAITSLLEAEEKDADKEVA